MLRVFILYEPDEKILICGDLFYKNDIGWINIFREGVASVQRSIESLDRLSALPIQQAYPGHGPQILRKTSGLSPDEVSADDKPLVKSVEKIPPLQIIFALLPVVHLEK